MNRKWFLAGVVAFGMSVGFAPASFAKEPGTGGREQAKERAQEYDEQIKYAELPAPVKETVDKERGKHELAGVYHVQRDGKEFYRAVIDTKGDNKVIRVQPGGHLLTEQEAKDVSDREVLAKHTIAGSNAGARREIRLGRGETDGEIVAFDRLPGEVKTEIGRLAKGDKVEEVIRYKSGGHTMYRAEVGQGKYTRFIRVDESGKVVGVRGDVDPGEVVPFDRTPGAVKSKIGALAKSGKVDEVIEYKRGGKTYYQAQVDEKNGKSYFYTVDSDGKEVDGLPRI
jgi:hypothetical protein